MNYLAQLETDDDGHDKDDPEVWHLVDPGNSQGRPALCTSEFFGVGESGCEFKTKTVAWGGITCPKCLEKLKIYKAVRL